MPSPNVAFFVFGKGTKNGSPKVVRAPQDWPASNGVDQCRGLVAKNCPKDCFLCQTILKQDVLSLMWVFENRTLTASESPCRTIWAVLDGYRQSRVVKTSNSGSLHLPRDENIAAILVCTSIPSGSSTRGPAHTMHMQERDSMMAEDIESSEMRVFLPRCGHNRACYCEKRAGTAYGRSRPKRRHDAVRDERKRGAGVT